MRQHSDYKPHWRSPLSRDVIYMELPLPNTESIWWSSGRNWISKSTAWHLQSVKEITNLVAEHCTVYHYTELITIIKPTETRLLNVHVCTWLNFFYQTSSKGDNLIELSVKDTVTFSHKRLLNNLKFYNNRCTYSSLVKLVQDNTPSSLDLCYNVLFVKGNFIIISFC